MALNISTKSDLEVLNSPDSYHSRTYIMYLESIHDELVVTRMSPSGHKMAEDNNLYITEVI